MEEKELLEKIKEVQLELASVFVEICERHNLRYFLAYGTLLGAVRHNGFIPWDDDIDIMIPYPDLLKFEEYCKDELPKGYFYQSVETDHEYNLTISRLCKDNTIMLEDRMANKNIHHGIFMDIYPLFGAPKGFKRKIQIFRAMKRALYLWGEPTLNHGKLMCLGSKLMLKLKPKKYRKKAVEKLFAKISYDYDESANVTVLDSSSTMMKRTYKKEWFADGMPHIFENRTFLIPKDYDNILKICYGDYMKLPPENQRKPHHDYIEIALSTDNSK